MTGIARYLRLFGALARYSLAREMTFRGNFLIRVTVEVLWLFILLVFYATVFAQTRVVADWNEDQYLFFVGCYFALNGLIETLFLENCSEFSELVRSGDLDFYLLQPMDEQFLISCRNIDWATATNVLTGAIVMVIALVRLDWAFDAGRLLVFLLMMGCGTAIAYSFLLLLTSTSVYFVRNQSLYELWWLVTSLVRYPREIFGRSWAAPLGWVFTFIIPVMLVVNIPAHAMVKALDLPVVGFTVLVTFILGWVSRKFFKHSLKKYRSASS